MESYAGQLDVETREVSLALFESPRVPGKECGLDSWYSLPFVAQALPQSARPVLSKLMVLVLMVPPPEGLLFLCLSCLPGYEDYSAPKYKGTERETWGAGTSGIEQPSFHSSLGCPE